MNHKIIVNKAKCKKCNDIIESKNVHDYKKCSCGSIAVDGGHEYIKRTGDLENVIELSEYDNNNKNISNQNFQPPIGEIINQNLQPIISNRNKINNSITSNVSLQLQNFSNKLSAITYQNYLNFNNQWSENMKPVLSMENEIISKMVKNLSPMQEIAKNLSETFKPIISQIVDNLPTITSYFKELAETFEKIQENPDNIYNWIKFSKSLNNYFWLPPYSMEAEQLMELLKTVETERQMDEQLEKYFTSEIIEQLFNEIENKTFEKHKEILKHIKTAYNNESYALANTGLFSVIDSLCSFFVVDKKTNTYRIDLFKPILEVEENVDDNYYNVLVLSMINNNINFLYGTNKQTHKLARRHLSQHGEFFSNNKIDTIMLLHTTYYLLICILNYKKYKRKLKLVKTNIKNKRNVKYILLDDSKNKK